MGSRGMAWPAGGRPALSDWQRGELVSERHKNRTRALRYVVPLCRELFGERRVRVLDAGCGNGEEVDALREAGYRAIGLDRGYRNSEWAQREHRSAFLLADVTRLPFQEVSFDLILSLGVIEHVGAVGDGRDLAPDFREQRERYAAELWRVTRPGGYVLVATPNRLCPFDVWHGPFTAGVHVHGPNEPFLVSFGEIRALFARREGFRRACTASIDGFFQFERVRRTPLLRALVGPVRTLLRLQSRAGFRWLRRTPLNPFLVVLVQKAR